LKSVEQHDVCGGILLVFSDDGPEGAKMLLLSIVERSVIIADDTPDRNTPR
jgi:hypothetical protein